MKDRLNATYDIDDGRKYRKLFGSDHLGLEVTKGLFHHGDVGARDV